MEHVHWWLAGLAFTLGMVLTSTLMVRPVEHQVLVKKSVRGSSAKSKPPTARKPAVKSGTKREESPTAKTKVATESAAEQIPVAGEPAAATAIAATTPVPMVRLSMSARELPASVPVWLVWHIPGGTVWAEEAAFRGALATIGARAFGRSGGRILQAGAFGLSHIADARATGEPLVLTVLATGIAGWMFGWLADRSGSLAAPLLTHLAINEAGAVAAVLVQRRSGISTRL